MSATEAGHWYRRDGTPCYTVPYAGKRPGERPTTLADARKLDLVPSVTTIIGSVLAKPGLEVWKINQAIDAALTLPMEPGETLDAYRVRVQADAKETARKAAERGTEIHGALELAFQGRPYPEGYRQHATSAFVAIENWLPGALDAASAERSFAHPLGFGGKVDLHGAGAGFGWVVDYKTTDKPLDSLKTWPEHSYQLAAYRVGLRLKTAKCAILYVHVDGDARLIELPEADIATGWEVFQHALAIWKLQRGV